MHVLGIRGQVKSNVYSLIYIIMFLRIFQLRISLGEHPASIFLEPNLWAVGWSTGELN